MKKSVLDRSNTELDLTSLLDVILIILMMVISLQYLQPREPVAVNPVPDDLKERVYFVNLFIKPVNELNLKNRQLMLVMGDEIILNEQIDSSVSEAAENEIYAILETKIVDYIKERDNENIPILLTLDDSHILYRDYKRISDILNRIESRNLYWNQDALEEAPAG